MTTQTFEMPFARRHEVEKRHTLPAKIQIQLYDQLPYGQYVFTAIEEKDGCVLGVCVRDRIGCYRISRKNYLVQDFDEAVQEAMRLNRAHGMSEDDVMAIVYGSVHTEGEA